MATIIASCDTRYTGFFESCVSCALIERTYGYLVAIGGALYPYMVPVALTILGTGMLFTVHLWGYYHFAPWHANKGPSSPGGKLAMEIPDAFIKMFFVLALMGSSYAGFGFQFIYQYVFRYPLALMLEGAMVMLIGVTAQSPSLSAIVAASCNEATTEGQMFACVAHITEASVGWSVDVLVKELQNVNIATPSFWFAAFLLISLTKPALESARPFLLQSFFAACTIVVSPILLALWVIPATRNAGRVLIEVSVQTGFVMMFGILATVASTAAVASLVSGANLASGITALGIWVPIPFLDWQLPAGADPFDCLVSAADRGILKIVPWEPTYWIIYFMAQIYAALLEEVMKLAGFLRQAIFGSGG